LPMRWRIERPYQYQQGSYHGYRSIESTTHPPTCPCVLVQGTLLASTPTPCYIYPGAQANELFPSSGSSFRRRDSTSTKITFKCIPMFTTSHVHNIPSLVHLPSAKVIQSTAHSRLIFRRSILILSSALRPDLNIILRSTTRSILILSSALRPDLNIILSSTTRS
jgi:hypothetical protein